MNFTSTQRTSGSPQRRPSKDSLDPLSEGGPANSNQRNTPVRSQTPSQQPDAPPSQSRFSVVFTASPNRASYHTPEVKYDDEEDDLAERKKPVISDLSPQFKKKMKAQAAKEAAAAPKQGRQASTAAKQLINNQYDKKKVFGKQRTVQQYQKTSASGTSTPSGPPRLGRPKGWKPGMSYAQMRGNPVPTTKPKPGVPGVAKRRGRPPKASSPSPLELFRMLKPKFPSFLCEWKDCQADLQNLATLRRHVNAVHLEEQDYEDEEGKREPWKCLWAKCGMAATAPTFETYEEMEEHVEQRHMVPFGWHIGDGPNNDTPKFKPTKAEGEGEKEEDEVPSYLKDKDGNQVTPSIKEQKLEDAAQYKDRRKRLWHMLKALDDNLPSEDEEEHPEPDDEEAMVI